VLHCGYLYLFIVIAAGSISGLMAILRSSRTATIARSTEFSPPLAAVFRQTGNPPTVDHPQRTGWTAMSPSKVPLISK
jgi:hypothetical protein